MFMARWQHYLAAENEMKQGGSTERALVHAVLATSDHTVELLARTGSERAKAAALAGEQAAAEEAVADAMEATRDDT